MADNPLKYQIAALADLPDCELDRSIPIRNEQGDLVGAVVVVRELSDQKRLEREARESEARFKVMADCAPVLLWMSGTDSECNFFNQTWLDFTGRPLSEELGVGWAEGVHHEDLQRAMDTYLEAFHARRTFEMEYRLRRKDGEYRWVLDRGVPRFNAAGEFVGFIGSCTDITERKRLERETRHLADHLARTNRDLEQFAFVASHDLQEPIRSVVRYTELLARRYRGKLDADAAGLMTDTVAEATRMLHLVQDLLSYARLGTSVQAPERVEVREVVDEVLSSLSAALEEAGAHVTVGELPALTANRADLGRVFQNLIANSLKFRSGEKLEIRISAESVGMNWVFSIKDNGIGIDMKYAQKIFTIFQRLHTRQKYEGSGIGLSVCKRIVESHGGRIWVESEPGKGATFFFSLPMSPDGRTV